MPARVVDAPRQEYLSARQAAQWLGVSLELFRALAAEQGWCEPVRMGRLLRWHWMDLVALSHILRRRAQRGEIPPSPPPPAEPRRRP